MIGNGNFVPECIVNAFVRIYLNFYSVVGFQVRNSYSHSVG